MLRQRSREGLCQLQSFLGAVRRGLYQQRKVCDYSSAVKEVSNRLLLTRFLRKWLCWLQGALSISSIAFGEETYAAAWRRHGGDFHSSVRERTILAAFARK
ncbi:hypothetical protein RvY_06309-5 [Ramazzottius varieornatus]|uniref:Uncharacterized protein n=1 Tax=Ramazzottius varieornatus TaxID=947166 RepID=A0A1D1V142_RAMVA|nr:hypothetical protein RvY_06309-5 [Ramazzottius varieornatus]